METKIPGKVYCHNSLEYNAVCYQAVVTTAGAQGVVGLLMRERAYGCIVESTRFQGLNMLSCKVVLGGHHTPLIRAYLPPVHT